MPNDEGGDLQWHANYASGRICLLKSLVANEIYTLSQGILGHQIVYSSYFILLIASGFVLVFLLKDLIKELNLALQQLLGYI